MGPLLFAFHSLPGTSSGSIASPGYIRFIASSSSVVVVAEQVFPLKSRRARYLQWDTQITVMVFFSIHFFSHCYFDITITKASALSIEPLTRPSSTDAFAGCIVDQR